MTAVHVIPAISQEASGPSYSAVRLCESLIDHGQDTALVALDWGPIAAPPHFLRKFRLGLGPRRLGRSPAMLRWLANQAGKSQIQLLHNHSLWMMPNVYPGWVAAKHDIPLVVSPRGTLSAWAFNHGSMVKRAFWPWIQFPALRATSCFHATCMAEYEDIRRMGFKQPVAVIPNGVDIPSGREVRKLSATRTLLFLGRIHPIKGLDLLLPAWEVLEKKFPEWTLRVVGPDDGGYLGKLRRWAEELKLNRIEFCGPLFGAEKWQAYSDADLLVLPTYSENFGMAVAEALAAGTPAVVSKGAPWAGLEEKDAGWWPEIGLDPLIGALEKSMAFSPAELRAKGARGRQWMEAEFAWNVLGRRMFETYRWLLGEGALPRAVLTA